jgi:hypothetical protein
MGIKDVLKQWFVTMRLVPVINWTITNSLIALALALYFNKQIDFISWLVASAVAIATQSFPAHVFNDIYDWLSGTDKLADKSRTVSGGSGAVQRWYRNNPFKHLANNIPWILVCAIAVYYFGFVLGWWWYVVLGGVAAVFISVFYSTPPIQADHRPFIGEWIFAFGGIMVSNAFIYYAAAHSWPSVIALLCMVPYVIGNIFMLEMHHVNDIYPDLHAKPKKKHTAVAWVYEKTRTPRKICEYFVAIASFAAAISLVLFWLGIYQAAIFSVLYLYGVFSLTSKYGVADFERYPDYLEVTVPLELRWIVVHTLTGLIFASTLLVAIP